MKTQFWVVLQQGGASTECYGSVVDSEPDADADIARHKGASCNATKVAVEITGQVDLSQRVDIADAMARAASEFMQMDHHATFGA